MKILIIGGKQFVGYHITKAALRNNHEVVFFNRGKTNSEFFKDSLNIIGDRNTDMCKLKGMTFDYVIDTCAYFPDQITKSLDVLEGHFKKYLLISTLSVIKSDTYNFDESVGVLTPDYTSKDLTAKTYGPLKSACEEILQTRLKDKAIIIRPGYIVGDMDYTDRFSYYPVMMHFNDTVIMPKTDRLRYSFVNGKDLGEFVIHSLETNLEGIYHTVGPNELYFDEFLQICRNTINPNCAIKYVDHSFFTKHNLTMPSQFPTCDDSIESNNVFAANTDKAQKAGFKIRTTEVSLKEALDYFLRTKQDIKNLKVGMSINDMKTYLKGL